MGGFNLFKLGLKYFYNNGREKNNDSEEWENKKGRENGKWNKEEKNLFSQKPKRKNFLISFH